jgi:hypothetical protein
MSSRSSISKNRSGALAVLAMLCLLVSTAYAGKKRVVVLDFEGDNAESIHASVVKLLKKSYTVVSTSKWNDKAEELGATKVSEKNVKKVAAKLKVDGVITGKVDKRRDEYIIKLKLRSGSTGELIGNSVSTKTDKTKLDAQAKRDIKDELIGAIDGLESNGAGGDDEEEEVADEEKPKKSGFSRKNAEDDTVAKDEEKKAKKEKKVDEEKAALSTKKEEEEEEAAPEEKEKKSKKRVAEEGEEEGGSEEGVEESVEVAGDRELNVSPGRRAIDAAVGMSFTARQLNFKYASDLGKPPPGYKQKVPVPGAMVDMTFYPLSFSHKPSGIISGLGLEILYDKVIKINSQKKFADGQGQQQTRDLATSESRWGVAAVLRYPLGQGPRAIVVGGKLGYNKQKFTVEQTLPDSGMPAQKTDIPNVAYTMLSPSAFVQAPIAPKIVLNADLTFHAVTDTGDIQTPAQYGAATVTGYEINLGADYMIKTNIFIRAGIRYEGIGLTFKGDPMSMTHTRDTDATDQDVMGAKDTYFGGAATLGYLY